MNAFDWETVFNIVDYTNPTTFEGILQKYVNINNLFIFSFVCIAVYYFTDWTKREFIKQRVALGMAIGFLFFWLLPRFNSPDPYDQYFSGQYSICEGVIENYIEDYESSEFHKQDTFSVNGENFIFSQYTPTPCPMRHLEGGTLQNGMYVRISYVYYKYYNAIMKIEVLHSNTESSAESIE